MDPGLRVFSEESIFRAMCGRSVIFGQLRCRPRTDMQQIHPILNDIHRIDIDARCERLAAATHAQAHGAGLVGHKVETCVRSDGRTHGEYLESIIAMVEQGKPCAQIAQQLQAVEGAIENAKKALIHDHISHGLARRLKVSGAKAQGKAQSKAQSKAQAHAAMKDFKLIAKYL